MRAIGATRWPRRGVISCCEARFRKLPAVSRYEASPVAARSYSANKSSWSCVALYTISGRPPNVVRMNARRACQTSPRKSYACPASNSSYYAFSRHAKLTIHRLERKAGQIVRGENVFIRRRILTVSCCRSRDVPSERIMGACKRTIAIL